jgi:hypothetical protein
VNAAPYVCTKAAPWAPDKGKRATHPDAECIYDGGWAQESETYKCPNCGKVFRVTIPS